jgi:hypothetical protein
MINHPIDNLAASVHAALLRDLPLITYRDKDWETWNKLSIGERNERSRRIRQGDIGMMPMTMKKRRPYMAEVKVTMFLQIWPTKAMGFAHKAESGATEAYTVIVEYANVHAVYFAGRLAYVVDGNKGSELRKDYGWKSFIQHLGERKLRSCLEAGTLYLAQMANRFGGNLPQSDDAPGEE